MTIDEKMKIVRKGLEQGANVSVNFHECDSKEEAKEIMQSFGVSYTCESQDGSKWLNFEHETDKGIELEIAAFYEGEDKSTNIVDDKGTLIASILHDQVILRRGYQVVEKEESEPFINNEHNNLKVVKIGN